jgi:hypothetical protein
MMTDDPLSWAKDQARLFQRDQRLKKASRDRLERFETEAPTRRKLADTNDTDEPGSEDWGRHHQAGMTAELTHPEVSHRLSSFSF